MYLIGGSEMLLIGSFFLKVDGGIKIPTKPNIGHMLVTLSHLLGSIQSIKV